VKPLLSGGDSEKDRISKIFFTIMAERKKIGSANGNVCSAAGKGGSETKPVSGEKRNLENRGI